MLHCIRMKRFLYLLLILAVHANECSAAYPDSLFINGLKQFIYKESQLELDNNFYGAWKESDKPYTYLYASLNNAVKIPTDITSVFLAYDTMVQELKKKEEEYLSKGYHTFIYKTYANSAGKLNWHFMSYSAESKSFIILHEFTHNYISNLKLAVPYEFNEALADVIGNYGTLEYLKSIGANPDSAEAQLRRNEKIYKIINRHIRKITYDSRNVKEYNKECEKKIKKVLVTGDLFQKDRFDYHVNNAYLVKNKYYSLNYFLMKKLFLKQKTLANIFRILKNAPSKIEDFKKYIEQYI
jgi:hypothetical protein